MRQFIYNIKILDKSQVPTNEEIFKLHQIAKMEFYIAIKSNGLKEYIMTQREAYNDLIYKAEYKTFSVVS